MLEPLLENKTQSSKSGNFELDFIALFEYLKGRSLKILIMTSALSFLAFALSYLTPDSFKSSTLLAPNKDSSAAGLGGLTSRFSGLASVAGLNINSETSKIDEALATLRSRSFTTTFIRQFDLKKYIFSSQWDAKNQSWQKEWGEKKASEPSDDLAFKLFQEKHLSITQDRKTGLVSIQVIAPTAELAQKWTAAIPRVLNQQFKDKEITKAKLSLKYLLRELEASTSVEINQALYQLIYQQKQNAMLASITENFVFNTIDPAHKPNKPFTPSPFKTALVTFCLGLVLIILIFCGRFTYITFGVQNDTK